ncbi:MAG: sodium:solute symporter family protein [Sedimentisphaerales bacterium]|jgi:SSS family solute:Na+ symporter|nr:sodium:solute symporter family protein [Sedimentisphaerales bacterium]HNY79139.1 sodium:solute symporter family protein [Sedimentisphaerales bacterium]HOC64181.1 sodium:solute symporter family protein [Sedimentisphaerales bacterium]HOH65047.1 sodium:solute symporter family protein [Sedimentisphaerales bacterium]HPY49408.1 sodium:solute symporter family protein [Sedimentisphaerales bacterium]
MIAEVLGGPLDYVVLLAYFVGIMVFGLWFGRYTASTKDFFFGGQRFSWWLISFSCVATLVGSYSFIKYSQAGFDYGISSTQTYFNDWFWMPILVLVWIPIIYYKRIVSIPEYLEARFDKKTRVAATCVILLYMVGYIGINLLTLGTALHTLLGWHVMTGATVTAVAVALYVYAGGQTAVIMTDLVQGIILLGAGLGLLIGGIYHFGGFGDFWSLLPQTHKYAFSDFNAPPKFSFIGIYVQDGLANTGALMLMNQAFILRFLSLKSVKDSRRMVICWILVLTPLAAVATSCGGWLAKALANHGELTTSSEDSFVKAADFLCSPGVFGFILAALTAALMSTADSLVNAVSAVFVNDIWRPYIRPAASDKHHLLVARITSLAAAGLGLALVPIFMAEDSIYVAHGMFTAAVTPPVVMAILLAILWKRYTPAAAFATIAGGGALIGLSFVWPDALVGPLDFGMGPDSYTFMRALFGLLAAGAVGVVVTWFTKAKPQDEIRGLVAGTQMDAMRQFKGGEPNRRPGGKVRLTAQFDGSLSGTNTVIVPRSALDKMAAEPGDLLYVDDVRWWYGGLRSVHVRAGVPSNPDGGDAMLISPEDAATAHFTEGQSVVVEKIL